MVKKEEKEEGNNENKILEDEDWKSLDEHWANEYEENYVRKE